MTTKEISLKNYNQSIFKLPIHAQFGNYSKISREIEGG